MPQGLPAVNPCSGGASSPRLSKRSNSESEEEGQGVLTYIWGSHLSETQPRDFQGKGGGGRAGGAVPSAGPEASACCCGKGWHGVLWEAGQAGANGAGSVLLVGCLGTLGAVADEELGSKGTGLWRQKLLA